MGPRPRKTEERHGPGIPIRKKMHLHPPGIEIPDDRAARVALEGVDVVAHPLALSGMLEEMTGAIHPCREKGGCKLGPDHLKDAGQSGSMCARSCRDR